MNDTVTLEGTATVDRPREAKEGTHLPAAQQATRAVAAHTSAASLLDAIQRAAGNPKINMETVERLFKIHETVVAREAQAAWAAAMARAQTKIQPIVTDAENDHTHSRYATLAAINEKIVPIYSAEGLSVTFDTETKNDTDPIAQGCMRTIAIVSHAAGHQRRYHIDLPPDTVGSKGNTNKTAVQAAGSTNEYARRYLTRMIFNIATRDGVDKDGNRVTDGDDAGGETGQQADGTPRQNGKPIYPNEQLTKELPKFRMLVQGKAKTVGDILNMLSAKYTLTDEQKARIRNLDKKDPQ